MTITEFRSRLNADYQKSKLIYFTIIAGLVILPIAGFLFWPHFYTDLLVLLFYFFVLWEIISRVVVLFGNKK